MNLRTFDQLSLHFETHGDPAAPPVFLLHGIGADRQMWQPQVSSLPAAGYFVITPDLRGHGASEVPQVFRISDCARDLCDLIDILCFPCVHLIGVSMGGMVAQQFVAQYPERASSQVIVDSLSGVTRPVERFNAWLAAVLLQFFPARVQAGLIRRTYRKLGHDAAGQYLAACLLEMPPRWLLDARREVNRFNILAELPKMNLPTLVLVGDAFGKLAVDMARTTAEKIPGAQFQVLPGGGDPSNLLVPSEFDRAVLAFLAAQAKPEI
ncbi:MAG: alpha/beta fold hydrolase [Chloroflexota bacterium]